MIYSLLEIPGEIQLGSFVVALLVVIASALTIVNRVVKLLFLAVSRIKTPGPVVDKKEDINGGTQYPFSIAR